MVDDPALLPLLSLLCLLYRPTVDLIGAMETQSEPSELELDDVVITNPHIEAILENEDWIEDASYVLLVTLWHEDVSSLNAYFSVINLNLFCEFSSKQRTGFSLHLYPKGKLLSYVLLCPFLV